MRHMFKSPWPLLIFAVGWQTAPTGTPHGFAPTPGVLSALPNRPDVVACSATSSSGEPLDLADLWNLTLANNPALTEAAADVGAARGRLVQAGLYPNPRFAYTQDTIGSRIARQGNVGLQLN
jgi:cobalt-zinc-cadmium efflux system outer membrane protein